MYQELNNRALRRSLLLGAASVATLCMTGAAFAQDSGKVETVVVTGSRIPTTNLTTTSPVTELSAEDVHTQGVTRVEDLINQLPQAFAAQNSTVSNGASGTATVDLRGLGSTRTLVLINGLRMPYGSPNDTAADLNEIPTQMVDRVEIVTGGASAVYGSDAISGVVNFVMKHDFEGFQIDAQYDVYQHDNDYNGVGNIRNVVAARAASNPSQFALPPSSVMVGGGSQVSAMMGVSSANGKGNVTAYFSYRDDQPILEKSYDYSACTLTKAATVPGGNFSCGGSATSYPGYFYALSGPFAGVGTTIDKTTGLVRAFTSNDQFNYGPYNYYQRPDQRYSLGAFGHYSVNSHVEIYSQLMFTDYKTVAQIAPSGNFFSTSKLNCGNPYLGVNAAAFGCTPADVAADAVHSFYVARRNIEGGGRQDSIEYTSYRAVVGVKGDLAPGWSYDVSGQYSKVLLTRTYLNEFSKTRLQKALLVDNTAAGPECQSFINGTDKNCVPWNIFQIGGVTQAALNYLEVPLVETGYTDLQNMIATVNGDLGEWGIKSPWSKSPVQVAIGAEYRENGLGTIPDVEFTTGDGAGQGGPTIGLTGRTNVTEGFTELKMPVAEGLPFAELVSLDAAYRYSSYNTGVTTNTWKVGGDWAPVDDFRLRSSYSHAVRAANVVELYSAQGLGLVDIATGDPCGPSMTATLAQCVATGVPAANYGSASLNNPAGQYNITTGGNPHLQAEKGNTFTVGGVFTPTFFPGFSGSVDYFDIRLGNEVASLAVQDILKSCYVGNVAAQCAQIHRNASGSLWRTGDGFIQDNLTNIGGLKTNGIDVNANYQMDLGDVGLSGYGGLTFGLVGTYLLSLDVNPGIPGSAQYNCAGFYGNNCGTPNPAWRHRFRTTWQMPWDDIGLTMTWRHYSAVNTYGGNVASIDYTLAAQDYIDLETSIPLPNNTTLRFGINNVFDSDPPITHVVGTTGNGNTYPQTYDALGRYLFAGININL